MAKPPGEVIEEEVLDAPRIISTPAVESNSNSERGLSQRDGREVDAAAEEVAATEPVSH